MPRIILVRPAETDHCLWEACLGRTDADLNELGHEQAERLARALRKVEPSFVAVSPLKRAIATAMPLCHRKDVTLHPFAGFQGVDLGEWENRSISSICAIDRTRYETWMRDPDFPAPGGESFREVYARAFDDLNQIIQETRAGETLVFVLQECVLRAVICALLDLPLECAKRFTMNHAGYAIFDRSYPDGPYQLLQWNQNAHLLDEKRSFSVSRNAF